MTKPDPIFPIEKTVGICADHGGYEMKLFIKPALAQAGVKVRDFGAHQRDPDDDYPDFVLPLAEAIAEGKIHKGIAVCGSGVGASIAANKIRRVRASVIQDSFSARQGVEDDDMNLLCLGGRILGNEYALELVWVFLNAQFSGAERHLRRLQKIRMAEGKG